MSTRDRPVLAVILTLTAIIGFDIMGILVRVLSERGYSAAELSAYRNVLGIIPSLIVLAWMGELKPSTTAPMKRWKLALFRGVSVAIAQLCFYSALGILELATISALAQTNGLFVVLLSVILLRETVGPWRIFAVLLGFAGALWVMRPGSDSFSNAAILPIIAAFFYAFSIVSVRLFDDGISNARLYIWASAASALAGIGIATATGGFSPIASGADAALIFLLSMAGGVAVLLLTFAYRLAVPSLLAPFSYLSILSAFFFGWLFFDEAPLDTLFPGVVLILAAGAVILWRENTARSK